jgi:hypothetical protein
LTGRDGVLVAQLLLGHVNNKREIVLKLLEQES